MSGVWRLNDLSWPLEGHTEDRLLPDLLCQDVRQRLARETEVHLTGRKDLGVKFMPLFSR